MIRYQKLSSGAAISPGRRRLMSLSWTVVGRDSLEPVAQEVRVEADLELLARVLDRERLRGLADVLRLRRDGELAVCEAQAQRRVSLRHQAGAADDLEQRDARSRDLDLEGLREKLLVVRELPVDAAAREPHVAGREDDVVLVHSELHVLGGAGEARELLERACGDDRVELGPARRERRLLHGQTIRVGRGHDQLVAFEADQNAGQDGPRLVSRRRAADLLDRGEERAGVDLLQGDVERRESREVLGAVDVQPRRVLAGGDGKDALALVVCERDRLVGQEPNEIGEEASRDDDARVAFDLSLERRPDRDLHVGRGEGELPFLGVQQDPSEHLHGAASRHSTRHDGQCCRELGLLAGDAKRGGRHGVCVHY